MSTKSRSWTSQPLFKVKLNKSNKIEKQKKKGIAINKLANSAGKLSQKANVNVFITNSLVTKIPFPPSSLLLGIDEETKKMKSKKTSINIQNDTNILNFSSSWDEDDLFLSDTETEYDLLSTSPNSVIEVDTSSKKSLNGFMAFRAYNSQFGYGLKQEILSSLLSEAWHSDPEQQKKWTVLSQQFNFVKPKCGFVEWVGQTYEREMMWCN
ncbi:HML mating-type cassette alpha1 protein [Vanderwaltozyma polyspora DSM 70294]|uniref:HML mating-type cassette alpha1 protein n=1 Tax=Vanderwaltozyma polyspora (strain ATCC 22028 / DSM 70294 / BCRC 21397 / CBS 2163 / NBRC 10782 / NRRL Y-8283 / UCD 57-17) TaxID=436907 RepID=A7TFC0_VANPO|nr:HML mating-type cassette alpha1 protein [Vanderwaltozyma polyspora DSM 70294]EDO18934.1 HML mating-type cassette alpha1 protein [Vanderwaltozyma polyspora DSM 70294]